MRKFGADSDNDPRYEFWHRDGYYNSFPPLAAPTFSSAKKKKVKSLLWLARKKEKKVKKKREKRKVKSRFMFLLSRSDPFY